MDTITTTAAVTVLGTAAYLAVLYGIHHALEALLGFARRLPRA